MKIPREALLAVAMAIVPLGHASVAGSSCESLLKLMPEHGTVTLAELVPAGAFRKPGVTQGASRFADLPAFWLPASGWNGKFEAVGNGGWAGTISYPAMAKALARGYATTSTDTGHSTAGGSFALGHPEKLIDYAYRSEHEMTVKAKAIVSAFYGSAPARSYFNGCSTGGRQALTEAARFPDDFDGIVAGAAANPKTRLDTWRIWMGLETLTCGGGEGRNTFDNDGAARAVGREGKGAGARRRLAPHERQDRSDTTAVPVPAGSALYGERQHRRRGELHLPFTMTVAVSPLISINVPKGLDASARR